MKSYWHWMKTAQKTDSCSSTSCTDNVVPCQILYKNYANISECLRTSPDENISNDEEKSGPTMPLWKKYARIILPHVGLILLSILYVTAGAFTFYHLERPNEISTRESNLLEISNYQKHMLNEVWLAMNDNGTSDEEVEQLTIEHLDRVTKLLFNAFDTHFITISHLNELKSDDENTWTITTAFFFTTTLLTTIGYGNLVPVTFNGRMFCIAYALFGVPLILMTIADIGKFLSENIIWIYTRFKQLKKRWKERRKRYNVPQHFVVHPAANGKELPFDFEQYTSFPIFLVFGILVGYVAVGAVLLSLWEQWDFLSGFYFAFITITTIGFGDIVPIKQQFLVFDLFYIIFGLAITTMCIDLVGIQYIQKIHYFGRAINDARYALVNVGGKIVQVPDLMRYAAVLQQKYGDRKSRSKFMQRPYTPANVATIKYIDTAQPSIDSFPCLLTCSLSKSNDHVNV